MIELMVVIAIIAVLAVISFPAYHAAKKRAYWAKTPRQMAKVIEAFHAYAADHNGYFPPAYFPDGADDQAQSEMDDDFEGVSAWLNSTIYGQVYPDNLDTAAEQERKESAGETSGSGPSYEQSENGEHLQDTVFVVQASTLAHPQDDNLYNHSFLLNRSLATDRIGEQDPFAPRNSTIYTDLSAVMLLTEGSAGDHYNSIAVEDAEGDQLEQGFERYDGKKVNVGYMDGHVVQVKKDDFRTSLDFGDDENQKRASHLFWKGLTAQELQTMLRTDVGRVNY